VKLKNPEIFEKINEILKLNFKKFWNTHTYGFF